MSGRKTAKTLIERFGFVDKDLRQPIHDEMMSWLLEPKNCVKMLSDLGIITGVCKKIFNDPHDSRHYTCSSWDWKTKSCNGRCSSYYNSDDMKKASINAKETFEKIVIIDETWDKSDVFKVELEKPILGYNRYNIGFIDAVITINNIKTVCGKHCNFYTRAYNFSTFPDFADLMEINVEVKSQITSVSELIRQINFYRSHVRNGLWVVMSPTAKFVKVLKSQDIYCFVFDKLKLCEKLE